MHRLLAWGLLPRPADSGQRFVCTVEVLYSFFLAGERVKSMEEWIDQASRRLYNAFEEFLKHNCRIYSRDWQKSAMSNDVGKSIYISNSPPSSMPLSSSSAHKPLEW